MSSSEVVYCLASTILALMEMLLLWLWHCNSHINKTRVSPGGKLGLWSLASGVVAPSGLGRLVFPAAGHPSFATKRVWDLVP
jgi:hypothetical protein